MKIFQIEKKQIALCLLVFSWFFLVSFKDMPFLFEETLMKERAIKEKVDLALKMFLKHENFYVSIRMTDKDQVLVQVLVDRPTVLNFNPLHSVSREVKYIYLYNLKKDLEEEISKALGGKEWLIEKQIRFIDFKSFVNPNIITTPSSFKLDPSIFYCLMGMSALFIFLYFIRRINFSKTAKTRPIEFITNSPSISVLDILNATLPSVLAQTLHRIPLRTACLMFIHLNPARAASITMEWTLERQAYFLVELYKLHLEPNKELLKKSSTILEIPESLLSHYRFDLLMKAIFNTLSDKGKEIIFNKIYEINSDIAGEIVKFEKKSSEEAGVLIHDKY